MNPIYHSITCYLYLSCWIICEYHNKNYLIHGRLDDVINIRGHRIGSAEIESVLLKVSDLIECGAIGVEDSLEGQVLIIFYSSVDNKSLNNTINSELIKKFGTFAVPRQIIKLPEIPKTRSGKILRRLLRDLYKNPKKIELGDTSTILNKSLINRIRNILLLKS